jgi:pimeloyl-ACP methyl ester carboxylesterase
MVRELPDIPVRLADVPPVPGVEHRDVAVNGVRLHVAEVGAGAPLILLHGWPQHWWCWRRLMLRLAEDYRVLALDLRGWGWSDAPRDDYAKATFATDILALMDAERLDRVSLLGHDWGGYTSFLLSLEHPERIARMIALDVTPPWPGRLQARHLAAPLMGSYQALLATPVLGPAAMTSGNGFIRRLIRHGSGPAMRWSDDELDVYAGVLREPRRANASSACYRSFLTRELPASLLGGLRARRPRRPGAAGDGREQPDTARAQPATEPQSARREDRWRWALPPGGGA